MAQRLTVEEAFTAYQAASSNYGRAMARWERGELSGHELGVFKRREGLAHKAFLVAQSQPANAEVPNAR